MVAVSPKDIDNYVPSASAAVTSPTAHGKRQAICSRRGRRTYRFPAHANAENQSPGASAKASSAPPFYLTMEINMDNAITSRAAMNEVSPVKISLSTICSSKHAPQRFRQHPMSTAAGWRFYPPKPPYSYWFRRGHAGRTHCSGDPFCRPKVDIPDRSRSERIIWQSQRQNYNPRNSAGNTLYHFQPGHDGHQKIYRHH